jgi:hypothetical protein
LYGKPHAMRRIAFVGGLAVLVVTPWMVRNYYQLGAVIPVRDGLGLELYISNNECAAPSYEENQTNGCHALTHPNGNPSIDQEIVQMGEYKFFQNRKRLALTWIVTNPWKFARLTFSRFSLFWLPQPDPLVKTTMGILSYVPWLITLQTIDGLYFLFKRNKRAAVLIGSAFILYPVVYYVVQFDVRYRYPIYWMSLVLAGIGFTIGYTSWRKTAKELYEQIQKREV